MAAGTLVISLDFELHWGRFDKVDFFKYEKYYGETQRTVPEILRQFKTYEIQATWATVGMLFAKDAEEWQQFIPAEIPTYGDPIHSPYQWFSSAKFPAHGLFSPDLVQAIAACPGQEVGSHTFSHYYTNELGQTESQFRADLRAAKKIALDKFGLELVSLVFPRNQLNLSYLTTCKAEGFHFVRSNPKDWYWQETHRENYLKKAFRTVDSLVPLGRKTSFGWEPQSFSTGFPIQIPASRFLRPNDPSRGHLNGLRITRILNEMSHAATSGLVYHLWWHPHNYGHHPEENLHDLEKILTHFKFLQERYGMRSESMRSLGMQG